MSKFILTAIVIALAIGIWSKLRQSAKPPTPQAAPRPRLRQMVRCTVCGAQVDEQLSANHGRGPQCLEHAPPSHKAR